MLQDIAMLDLVSVPNDRLVLVTSPRLAALTTLLATGLATGCTTTADGSNPFGTGGVVRAG